MDRSIASIPVPGRRSDFLRFVDDAKNQLVAMGFRECDCGFIGSEFWNGDCLFLPQDHLQRQQGRSLRLCGLASAETLAEPYFSRVDAAHSSGGSTGSRGWHTGCSPAVSRQVGLQSSVLGVLLQRLLDGQNSCRYFALARCVRNASGRPAGLNEVYRLGVLIAGDDASLKRLLNLFDRIVRPLCGGINLRLKPGYSPTTEPTICLEVSHPATGWTAAGSGGLLRPEAAEALGASVPVLVLECDLDCLAMAATGIQDAYDLYRPDTAQLWPLCSPGSLTAILGVRGDKKCR